MPLILPGNVASATAAVYEVANSCRFNDDDTAYMHLTPGSAGDQKKWTFSCWFKRGNLGAQASEMRIFGGNANASHIYLTSGDLIRWDLAADGSGSADAALSPSMLFRDCSAWYHLVCALDTDNGTADNRMRIYVNGTEISSFGTRSNPSSGLATNAVNDDTQHSIGYRTGDQGSAGMEFDGYMAEVCFVNSEQLTAASFGEFDSDSPTIWKPKDVSGLTFGTNGFYLDFEASGNLGNDANGGTDWTEVNLAAADQAPDTPTNNFATFNSILSDNNVLSEGNLKSTQDSGTNYQNSLGTIAVSSGKWYVEVKATTVAGNYPGIGMIDVIEIGAQDPDNNGYFGQAPNDKGIQLYTNGFYSKGDQTSESLDDPEIDSGDIISIALDLDSATKNIKFYKNGTEIDDTSIAPPTVGGGYVFGITHASSGSGAVAEINFGHPSFAISSGNADANGYGNFEYAVPSGYFALCTKNLAEHG